MPEKELPGNSPDFFRTVLDASPAFISVLDKDGIFKYVNKVVAGLDATNVVGSSIYDYVPEADKITVREHVTRALAENITVHYEIKGAGPNGIETIYKCSVSPITWESNKMALIISEDVSRIRQIESEMLKKVEDLETMNRAMVDRELAMVELKKELSELRGNK